MRQLNISGKLVFCIIVSMICLLGSETLLRAMPAQVMIIRHAEKFEDRQKIHLNPRGQTRAMALSQFFQSDPRVLEHGVVAAIIAQKPSDNKKSVRCEETVEPLAQALGKSVINRFAYGEVRELVEWLRNSNDWDSKSVLVCAQHTDILPLAKAFGANDIRQSVWPHETYDRVWVLDFSPSDGKLASLRDIPQSLLFGDSFQTASGQIQSGVVQFDQSYSESLGTNLESGKPSTTWKCRIVAQVAGDFSEFDDGTVPMLRLGGFTFGYYGTSLGKLKKNPDAEISIDQDGKAGSLRYSYKAKSDGVDTKYAHVTFSWSRDRLLAEFQADIDENRIDPDLNLPVELHFEKVDGNVSGVANCYLAFGRQRFYVPAGLSYTGVASRLKDASGKQVYTVSLKNDDGVLVRKLYLPEL